MLKIVVLGAGEHSTRLHLPALARYVSLCPGEVELAALCDLRRDHAVEMAARFGFSRIYTDVDEMLTKERPDGFIAITPWEITADITRRAIAAGIPVLMEKPIAQTIAQAKQLVALAEKARARVMVSMNRRFAPSICALLACKPDRPLSYLRASIIRICRTESCFWTTAIHPIDTMRHIAGDVNTHSVEVRSVDGTNWYFMRLVFASGAMGMLEVIPTAGMQEESYELYGANYRAVATLGVGTQCWEHGKRIFFEQPAKPTEPECIANGTYGETVEFISALKEKRAPRASMAEVLQSMELSLSMHAAGVKAADSL